MSTSHTRIGLGQLRSDTRGYLSQVSNGATLEISRRRKLVACVVSARAEQRDRRVDGPKRVELSELRVRAGQWFDHVATGRTIEVLWDGCVVARIEPIPAELPPR